MNSRFLPLTSAVVSLLVAIFFIVYFDGVWRWLIVSPMLIFITCPCFKIGVFSSQEEVDEMTGANKLNKPISFPLLLIEIIYFCRYPLYLAIVYLSYKSFSLYFIPLLAVVCCLVKSFDSIRFNILRAAKRSDGVYGLIKKYPFFYIQDLIIVGVLYGLSALGKSVL